MVRQEDIDIMSETSITQDLNDISQTNSSEHVKSAYLRRNRPGTLSRVNKKTKKNRHLF